MTNKIVVANTTTAVAHRPTLVMNLPTIPTSITHGEKLKKK